MPCLIQNAKNVVVHVIGAFTFLLFMEIKILHVLYSQMVNVFSAPCRMTLYHQSPPSLVQPAPLLIPLSFILHMSLATRTLCGRCAGVVKWP